MLGRTCKIRFAIPYLESKGFLENQCSLSSVLHTSENSKLYLGSFWGTFRNLQNPKIW